MAARGYAPFPDRMVLASLGGSRPTGRGAMGGFFAGFTEVALAKVGMEADIGRGTDELVEVWQAVCPHPRRPVFRRGQDARAVRTE